MLLGRPSISLFDDCDKFNTARSFMLIGTILAGVTMIIQIVLVCKRWNEELLNRVRLSAAIIGLVACKWIEQQGQTVCA